MISYLVISDIHLGHNVTGTNFIVSNLLTYFKINHAKFKKLDIIFLAGDVFDKLLNTNSVEYKLAISWLLLLCSFCAKRNIRLRILEGTPSHDREQASILKSILDKTSMKIDYSYFDSIYIETIAELGLTVLYVPDDNTDSAVVRFLEIKKKLKEKNLERVDIAIMHGYFEYQLPVVKTDVAHKEADILGVVKYYISIGHHHVKSNFDRIQAQGSFDCVRHGEGGDKGGNLIKIYNTGDMTCEFIVNKKARVFNTLDYRDKDDLYVLSNIMKDILALPRHSSVLIKSNMRNIGDVVSDIRERNKTYLITLSLPAGRSIKTNDVCRETTQVIEITNKNIETILSSKINDYSKQHKSIIHRTLLYVDENFKES